MEIRLLKEFDNRGVKYPVGQLLTIDEKGAETLIGNGTAEKYVPKANDEIQASPYDGGLSKKAQQDIIAEVLKQTEEQKAKLLNTGREADVMLKTGGFVNMAEFAQAVAKAAKGTVIEKLAKWNSYVVKTVTGTGANEGINADGGFLVPTEFRNMIMQDALEASIVRPRATVIPMATNSVKIPVVTESTHASSFYGGVIIYRPGEGGDKTLSKPQFGQIELVLHKLVGLVKVTDELLEDSPVSVQPLLTTMFSEAIAFQEDEDFINGTGAGQALGVINAPALVSQTKENGQAAVTIVTENIIKMYSRMKPRSIANAVWLANSDTFPQLATLKMNVGTGGSAVGLVTTIGNAPGLALLGKPLILTEHCQTLGTAGDILFCDWKQYLIGEKASGLQVASSIHLRFDYDETVFRFVLRYAGQPWEKSTLTPKHSSNTLGSFVALNARA